MIQGYDSLQLRSPEQDLEPFHRSLEIQFSNPNWLTIRTKTELKVAKSIHQMGHFYPRILFSYREKSSDYQIHEHHQMVKTKTRSIILFAAKDGEVLYSQQKQDQELTIAQIMNTLLPNSNFI